LIGIGCNTADGTVATNQVSTTFQNNLRVVTTNGMPDHEYNTEGPQFTPTDDQRIYKMEASPTKATAPISILQTDGQPKGSFGIAINGVDISPAPATPFIFEDTNTGEYNWDWVFEPTKNLSPVGLDCNEAHVNPSGTYHYHGDMLGMAKTIDPDIETTPPTEPVHIGWAADGFPILYGYALEVGAVGAPIIEAQRSSWQSTAKRSNL